MHLVETTLAADIGVSRTPVREALRGLEQDGLVERTSRGLQVRRRSPGEILEIFEVRIALEGMAAQAAAHNHNEIDVIRIQRTLHALETTVDAEPSLQAGLNRDFHRSIWQASHNGTLVDILDRLSAHLSRYAFTTYEKPGRPESSLVEHRELAEAILQRDGERAGKLASHHMTVARDIRLEMWAAGVSELP